MNQKGSSQQQYAMLFGTYMGIYWILKFILFPLSLTIPFLSFAFIGLTIVVPYLGYRYTKIYNESACNGQITFLQGWFFNIFMYMFASLLTAMAHYIYFRFIDRGFIADSYAAIIEQTASQQGDIKDMQLLLDNAREALRIFRSTSSIDITMQLLSFDIFIGTILGIPTALIAMSKRTKRKY